MFSFDNSYIKYSYYFIQKDFYFKAIGLACGVFFVVDYIRAQTPEIEVLQLIPGLYLFLLFLSWVFLTFFTIFLERIPMEIDSRKTSGTKTINRIDIGSIIKCGLVLATNQLMININTVVPIALDSFNSYGEKTLENIWSLDEIVALEIYLLFVIIILSQVPILIGLSFSTQDFILRLPRVWRFIGVSCFTIGGVVTPTIDVITQVAFAASTYSLYLAFIAISNRRLTIKYKETFSLS